ncbi:hypothetical protein B9479_008365, partial [Cryptococcus floricola]
MSLETRVRQVLSALQKAGFVCSPSKSQFFLDEASFLGHTISENHIGPDPKKIETLMQWPAPTTVKQQRSFIGLLNYVRKFIPNLAAPLSVLTALMPPNKTAEKAYTAYMKKKEKGEKVDAEGLSWSWDWSMAADQAFEECNSLLAQITGLIPLDYDAVKRGEQQVYLYTDASNTGIGAWLGAGNLPDAVAPIAYFSRSLIPAETRYPVHDKEMLAIVEALKEWRPLLLGIPVNVMTDHATLRHFFTQPSLSDRQKRWSEVLNNYNF